MKNIRTVIWDLDETVWFYKDNEPEILCKKLNITELEKFKKQYYATLTNLFVYFKGKIVTYEKLKKYMLEIKSVWFNPKKKKNDTNIIPDIEVQSLIELKRYF